MFGALGIEYLFENLMKAVDFEPLKREIHKRVCTQFHRSQIKKSGYVFSYSAHLISNSKDESGMEF